jgi:hypothetical protein
MIALTVAAAADTFGAEPDELRIRAKDLARDRKIMRLLDPLSIPPFVAAVQAFDAVDGLDPARTALFTVSSWEPWMASPQLAAVDGLSHAEVFQRLIDTNHPTEWLRAMANNTLCQIAIARKLRGPNLHVVGDASQLASLLALAALELGGTADAALLVAFDTDDVHRHDAPDDAPSRAAAVVLIDPRPAGDADGSVDALRGDASDVVREWRAPSALSARGLVPLLT